MRITVFNEETIKAMRANDEEWEDAFRANSAASTMPMGAPELQSSDRNNKGEAGLVY
jgi:hypothetical protein